MAHKNNTCAVKIKTEISNEEFYASINLQRIKEEDYSAEDLNDAHAYTEDFEKIYVKEEFVSNISPANDLQHINDENINVIEDIANTTSANFYKMDACCLKKTGNVKTEVNDDLGSIYNCNVKIKEEMVNTKAATKSSIDTNAQHTDLMKSEKDKKPSVYDTDNTTSQHLAKQKRTRDGDRPYVCDVCNKAFAHSRVLVVHKRRHTGERPYVCDVCDKAFTQSQVLIGHRRTHTGEKSYVCDVCNKAFAQQQNLVTHKRTHTGEKPYVCLVCNKAFAKSHHLVKHNRTHTGEKPYVCYVCNKAFAYSQVLAVHTLTHTGERSYLCDICNKAFARKHDLTRHKRSHTGEKYECDVCSKSFTESYNLVKHKRTHTAGKY